MDRARLLRLYYLATPLFFVLDVFLSAPIRVAALNDLGTRGAYMTLVFVIAVAARARPGLTAALGLLESSVNFFLLIVSVLLPVWGTLDQVDQFGPITLGLAPETIWNALLTGPVLILSFKESEAAIQRKIRSMR